MKKKSLIGLCLLPLLLAMVALFPACKKDNGGAPSISDVKQYVTSPKDTVLSTGNPNTSPALYGNGGNYVVIQGSNLQNPTEIDFDGVPSSFNPALITSNNAVVPIPTINYTTIDTAKLYSIFYKTKAGSTRFWFKLGPVRPTISAISNVFANPGDSVYVYGANLVLVQQFIYGGTPIKSFNSNPAGTSLGFLMPATTPTSLIKVVTKSGIALDTINATPTIISISNENADPGDSVFIHGTYLKNITKFMFAGVAITSFTSSKDMTTIAFVSPSNAQAAPVSVTTQFGTATTVFNVQDRSTGSIASFDYGAGNFGWQYWGGANVTSGNSDFPGNSHPYAILNNSPLSPGQGNTYSSYAIRIQNETWVPSAHINDPPGSWALKFEVSVPRLWNGSSIAIFTDFNNSSYVYRWEPWQITSSETVAYKTKGWITVTVPLSSFKGHDATLGDGEGLPITSIADLIGPAGNNPQSFFESQNYGTTTSATGFYGAFGNIRVVKIK